MLKSKITRGVLLAASLAACLLPLGCRPAATASNVTPTAVSTVTTIQGQSKGEGEGEGQSATAILPGNVPLEMVWCVPGTFMMGSPDTERDHRANEGPQHQVTLTHGFWMGKYLVTQAQWQTVMGSNPSLKFGSLLESLTIAHRFEGG